MELLDQLVGKWWSTKQLPCLQFLLEYALQKCKDFTSLGRISNEAKLGVRVGVILLENKKK